jgi:hypothetical protein
MPWSKDLCFQFILSLLFFIGYELPNSEKTLTTIWYSFCVRGDVYLYNSLTYLTLWISRRPGAGRICCSHDKNLGK